jgi:predicted esterase
VKAQRATKAVVDVQFVDTSGEWSHEWACYIGAKDAGDAPVTHDWREYSANVVIPPHTETIAVALQIYGPGQVWFDELTVAYAGRSDETASPERPSSPDALPADNRITLDVRDEAQGEYLLVEPTVESPEKGYGLVVILPGGDGSADFHPFVKRIHEVALEGAYVVAQPIANKWKSNQQIVWPTRTHRTAGMKFATEELVARIVDDVAQRHALDRSRVYLLAWSSGGPAAYATLLDEDSPATGALIAMSVYQPDSLPDVAGGKNKRFYLLHSEQDRVCPYRMAVAAEKALSQAGAQVALINYEGGHGWHGDVFGNIRRGIRWLDEEE